MAKKRRLEIPESVRQARRLAQNFADTSTGRELRRLTLAAAQSPQARELRRLILNAAQSPQSQASRRQIEAAEKWQRGDDVVTKEEPKPTRRRQQKHSGGRPEYPWKDIAQELERWGGRECARTGELPTRQRGLEHVREHCKQAYGARPSPRAIRGNSHIQKVWKKWPQARKRKTRFFQAAKTRWSGGRN